MSVICLDFECRSISTLTHIGFVVICLRPSCQVACTLSLIAHLNNYSPTKDVCLAMHMGIGAGRLSGLFVGGVENNWEFFVAGPPIQQMADACDESKSGTSGVTDQLIHVLRGWALSIHYCAVTVVPALNARIITLESTVCLPKFIGILLSSSDPLFFRASRAVK